MSRPPGFRTSWKFLIAILWFSWSPVRSGRCAKEFPRQITQSNPPSGNSTFPWFSAKSSQFPSSITDKVQKNVFRVIIHLENQELGFQFLPHSSKACSFLRSHLAFNAYFNILSLASKLLTLKPFSSNNMESTLEKIKLVLTLCEQFSTQQDCQPGKS